MVKDSISNPERIDTTLGDLIFVLTEETRRFVKNERDAYKLVAVILGRFLTNDAISDRSE